jgi:hypothetical protein
MKKLYTILLVTFMSANLFGQTGYRLDPGKINIWSNSQLTSNNFTFPGAVYTGVENLLTLNYNSYYSYSRVIGIRNIVNTPNNPFQSPIGIESVATGPYSPIGIVGSATGNFASGLRGYAFPTNSSDNGSYSGVEGYAFANGASATNYGVYGSASGTGSTSVNYGIYGNTSGSSSTSYAGYFNGKVHVNGTLSKSAGTFKIDHPLDPLNKYLSHSFVESPDMMNIYNGNITTDQNGRATVNLPDYFEALNMDFRYQLTAIGVFSQAIVMEEIKGNQFIVASDKPNVKVSWQVTGVRNDAYAKKNRVVPEQDKPEQEKGKYLNADAFGLPREESLHAVKAKEPQKAESLPTDKNQEPKKD